mmetsp:Transcript_38109/g.68071  ORF Transcript_38109/g.68071 Transcript_38109/m.68071 type:complete len:144 (-) Transcript_38109:67-498(-)
MGCVGFGFGGEGGLHETCDNASVGVWLGEPHDASPTQPTLTDGQSIQWNSKILTFQTTFQPRDVTFTPLEDCPSTFRPLIIRFMAFENTPSHSSPPLRLHIPVTQNKGAMATRPSDLQPYTHMHACTHNIYCGYILFRVVQCC